MNTYEAFQILDLNYYATEYEVKQKYKDLVKQYHPDVCSWDSTAYFQKINNAYEIALDFASKNKRAQQPPAKTGPKKPVNNGSKKTGEYTRKNPYMDKNKRSLSNLMMWLIIGGVALVLLLMLIPGLQMIVLIGILYAVTRIL